MGGQGHLELHYPGGKLARRREGGREEVDTVSRRGWTAGSRAAALPRPCYEPDILVAKLALKFNIFSRLIPPRRGRPANVSPSLAQVYYVRARRRASLAGTFFSP